MSIISRPPRTAWQPSAWQSSNQGDVAVLILSLWSAPWVEVCFDDVGNVFQSRPLTEETEKINDEFSGTRCRARWKPGAGDDKTKFQKIMTSSGTTVT